MKRFFAILMAFFLVISGLPVYSANAAAYDPVAKTEGEAKLDLRFWEDQQPDVGFYINAANRYILETVKAPQMGSTFGEWSVMDLLRGSYSGSDYLNYIPANYYEDYLDRINNYVISKGGNLDNNKSTEWSRLTLTMSSLGKDIRAIGKTGKYLKTKEATVDGNGGYKFTSSSGSQGLGVVEVRNNQFTLTEPAGVLFSYTNRSNKATTVYQILPPGTYSLLDDHTIIDENKKQVTFSYEEKSGSTIYATHTLITVPSDGVVVLEKPYDFIEKLSTSYAFSYKQGINGPIWILIALHTGGYSLYSEAELKQRGIDVAIKDVTINKIKVKMKDLNTEGRMIDYILEKEITSNDGRIGGWALTGKNADPDITMMAVQGLAPYYLSEEAFKNAYKETIDPTTIDFSNTTTPTGVFYDVESEKFKEKYVEFKKAVERAVFVMAEDQKPNGGYASWGTTNSESTVQVIAGLTALNIDPLSDKVYLPTIDQTVSFIKEGGIQDGVTTNNMIDALISFWAMGSGSSSEVSGFKHVTQGYDGGGGSGTSVNAMATDQAIYGLIAYDRFLKKEKRLYDMTDMINGEYKTMKAKTHTYTYMSGETVVEQGTFSPYKVLTIPDVPNNDGYITFWTTQADGTGAVYKAGERLSTPDHAITLYAQYVPPYEITYDLNEAQWIKENAEAYESATRTLTLPTSEHIQKENHVFDGWYTTADFQGDAIKTLTDPTQLQHSLYAKWTSYDTFITNANAAIESLPAINDFTLADESRLVAVKTIIKQVPSQVINQVKDIQKVNDLEAMLYVLKAIKAIRSIPDEQLLTSADSTLVQDARTALNLVPENALEKVTNLKDLTRAEDVLKIRFVEETIASLPEQLNLTHITLIEDLTSAINQLPGSLQIEVKNMAVYKEKLEIIQQLQQQSTDIDYANEVRNLINALPKEITLEHEKQFKEAKEAYNRLTRTQQELLNYEYLILNSLESQINKLFEEQQLEQIKAQIAALPAVGKLTVADKETVIKVYDAYLALSLTQQYAIDSRQLNRTVAALIELLIDALPATVTDTDKPALNEIRYLYKEADYTIQSLVTNYNKLEQAYTALENYPKVQKVNEVETKIDLIPATITVASKATIEAARLAYNALTEEEKAFVTNYIILTQAEKILIALEKETENKQQIEKQIEQMKAQIAALPAISKLTVKDKDAVIKAYNAYLDLPYDLKQAIDNRLLNRTVAMLIELQIDALPATVTDADKPALNEIRYLYNEVDYSIQSLVTNYNKLEQAYRALDNYPKIQKANEVIAKINLIPTTVTISSKATIESARLAYEILTTEEKEFVTNYFKLIQAENTLSSLENEMQYNVDQLVNAIRQLPSTITLADKNTVTSLLNTYNSLSALAKVQVVNYQSLAQAVQTINTLETQEKQIIQAMQAAISSLPDTASITLNHKLIIEDVRSKYNSLTASQKASINLTKLSAAEAQLQKLIEANIYAEKPQGQHSDKENEPIQSEPNNTNTDNKLIIHTVTNGTEKVATITPAILQSLTVPTVEIETNEGIKISLPKNALNEFNKPIQVSTNVQYTGIERSIEIKFGTNNGLEQVTQRLSRPFKVRIPVSAFMGAQASTNIVTFNPGVILGYSPEKGYYAVPHIYKNGEFIVTVSEGHKLVHRSEQITFDDIQSSIFQDEIEYLASRFVIKGFDDATFRPDVEITRGQFAALISRALDLKPTKPTTFRDGFYSPYRDDIQAVYESGIMRGYTETKFGVNDPLTREQAAATMARVLEYMDYEAKRNLVYFKDKNEINPEFVKQIELLSTLNIMSGHADGSFKPKDHLTRGQLAKILQRTLKLTDLM